MHRENELEMFHNLSPNLIVGAGKEWNAGNQGRVKVQNQIFSNKHREAATEIRGTHKGKHANMQKQRKKVKDSTEDARIAWKNCLLLYSEIQKQTKIKNHNICCLCGVSVFILYLEPCLC